jgi:hypothetical protein
MVARFEKYWFRAGRATLLLLVIVFCTSQGLAQTPAPPVYYLSQRGVDIPYSAPLTQQFKQMRLCVSDDNGRNYREVGVTSRREGTFNYKFDADGWYCFLLQVQDTDDRWYPQQLNETIPPQMRICIDTRKPEIKLEPTRPREGRVAVQWLVSDANLDLSTLRLEYRAVQSQQWIPRVIRQLERAQFCWSPEGAGPWEVRLTVADKARNEASAIVQVAADPSQTFSSTGAGNYGTAAAQEPNVFYVNKRVFNLNYKIADAGPSKIRHVEVWQTRDMTQWSLVNSNARMEGPTQIRVMTPGRYGYILRAVSGVGKALPQPSAATRDRPQIWVQVDETPPKVELGPVIVGEGDKQGTIRVQWRASDEFLADNPITIYYSTNPQGPWQLLEKDVENSGVKDCSIENLPFEFYLRIEAVDRAGNKSYAQTRDLVKVDLSIPKVVDITVNPSVTPESSPPSGGTGPESGENPSNSTSSFPPATSKPAAPPQHAPSATQQPLPAPPPQARPAVNPPAAAPVPPPPATVVQPTAAVVGQLPAPMAPQPVAPSPAAVPAAPSNPTPPPPGPVPTVPTQPLPSENPSLIPGEVPIPPPPSTVPPPPGVG